MKYNQFNKLMLLDSFMVYVKREVLNICFLEAHRNTGKPTEHPFMYFLPRFIAFVI